MGADDDLDCVEHVWQLRQLVFGAEAEYSCTRCGALLVRTPGQPFPG